MISLLRITVRPEAVSDFEHAFSELRIFEEAQTTAGLRRGRLLRPSAPDEPYVVIGEWERVEDYERWLDSPVRERLAKSLEPLVAGEPAAGETYTVVTGY